MTGSAAADETVTFCAPCANGHLPNYVYPVSELRELLQNGAVRLYCVSCDESRVPTAEELLDLERLATK